MMSVYRKESRKGCSCRASYAFFGAVVVVGAGVGEAGMLSICRG